MVQEGQQFWGASVKVSSKNDAMQAFEDNYKITIADTDEMINESFRLRYQVYCLERNFLTGRDGLESDEFDAFSYHTLLVNRATEEVVGSARLIVGSRWRPGNSFPMQLLCNGLLPRNLPIDAAAEISRFAISKARRNDASTALMRLALVRGLVALSANLGITHWCAVMEPSLLRLLQATSIFFEPFGPVVEYHGLRQPCYNSVSDILDRVAEDRPQLWDFLTEGGALWNTTTRAMRDASQLVDA